MSRRRVVITGVGMLTLAFVFQTLASRKPDVDGGGYGYARAGFGNYIASSLFSADMNAVLGGTILVGAIFVFLNLLSDVLYRALDPRSQ